MTTSYESMSRAELGGKSQGGGKLATLELERRSHAARRQAAEAWAGNNLDRVVSVPGPSKVLSTGVISWGGPVWGMKTIADVQTSSYRGKLRDLLAAGHAYEYGPYRDKVSAADLHSVTGDPSAVEHIWHEPATVVAQS